MLIWDEYHSSIKVLPKILREKASPFPIISSQKLPNSKIEMNENLFVAGLSTDTAYLMATFVLLNIFFILADVSASSVTPNPKCKKSEFTCNNGKCIPSNSFCNNVNDCGDSSDEPRYCTSKYCLYFSLFRNTILPQKFFRHFHNSF